MMLNLAFPDGPGTSSLYYLMWVHRTLQRIVTVSFKVGEALFFIKPIKQLYYGNKIHV